MGIQPPLHHEPEDGESYGDYVSETMHDIVGLCVVLLQAATD